MTTYPQQTWRFNNESDLIAPEYLEAAIGSSAVLLRMDFTNVIPSDVALDSGTTPTITVADVAAATEPTLSNKRVSDDRRGALVDVSCASATAATYTFTVTVATTDSQTIVRKGRLVVS